jgi:hypothetical protein
VSTATTASYRPYWIAWGILLCLTLIMLFLGSPLLLLIGMSVKAAIITLWFMHLRDERTDFIVYVVVGLFVMAAFMAALFFIDGRMTRP